MSEEEIRKYYEVYTGCWKLFKKYATLEKMGDEEWKQLIDEAGEFRERYNDLKCTYPIIWETMQELDRIWSGKGGESDR